MPVPCEPTCCVPALRIGSFLLNLLPKLGNIEFDCGNKKNQILDELARRPGEDKVKASNKGEAEHQEHSDIMGASGSGSTSPKGSSRFDEV